MFSQVGKDDYSGIGILIAIVLLVVLAIYAAYFIAIIGGVAGGGFSIYNYGLSFKKNIVDENFSFAK